MGERSDVPLPHSEYTLHVVMVGTEHPGNLGAVCRSLLNHGFDSLRLVQPRCHPDDIEAVIVPNMRVESSIPAKSMIHLKKLSQIVHLSLERPAKEKLVKKRRSVTSCILGNSQKE